MDAWSYRRMMNPRNWPGRAALADQYCSPADVDVLGHQLASRDAPEGAQAA